MFKKIVYEAQKELEYFTNVVGTFAMISTMNDASHYIPLKNIEVNPIEAICICGRKTIEFPNTTDWIFDTYQQSNRQRYKKSNST